MLWICRGLVVQLVVQQIHNKSNKWSLTLARARLKITTCLAKNDAKNSATWEPIDAQLTNTSSRV